jgi:RNA polymerase sigma-70 factor (ECF subfamily)
MSWDEITILVDRAKTGDRAAYGELVERFQAGVYAMALTKVRNPTDAQELAQEVFVHAMRKIGQLRDARCFAGWLRQITARMAINRLTRKGPMCGTEPGVLDSIPGHGRGPAHEVEVNESKAELHEALKELKPDDRAALEAFYLRGRSLKQLSKEFEAPIGTIKRRLHVARHRLKAVMEDRDGKASGNPRQREAEAELLAV